MRPSSSALSCDTESISRQSTVIPGGVQPPDFQCLTQKIVRHRRYVTNGHSPLSPRLIRWASLIEASQSSRIRRASIRNDLPAGVSETHLRCGSKNCDILDVNFSIGHLGLTESNLKRQTRLAARKSLDLTFLVTTEHHCLLGELR